ncbi:Fc.00g063450.m01.CDS01 [Cosmosporella sp. VM-42]
MPRYRFHKKDFSIHKDAVNAATLAAKNSALHDSAEKTLTPASTGSINSMKGRGPTQIKQAMTRSSTIRSVPSFEDSGSSPESKHSAFSSSVNSNTSAVSTMAGSQDDKTQPSVRLKNDSYTERPSRWSTGAARVVEPTPEPETSTTDGAEHAEGNQWDSTIGKAGLGKTGRVINKLVSDNEALKRDIKFERLKSDEAKQAAKLVEDKMERVISDYESRLLEANVTKTLLARKERQVETLTAAVEAEKKKTQAALDRERSWKEELDKMRSETTVKVEEATSYAQLMEGRYNSISSHWRGQGKEVKGALTSMKSEIAVLNEERRKDDGKIQTLRELCDQQDGNIKQLRNEKDDIAKQFEEYKRHQEDMLKDIKTNARRTEDEQEKLLEESREALAKLKWALNVKENVNGAQ